MGVEPIDEMGRGFRLLAALLAAVLFLFPLVLGHPLLDPDEGLHAAIAREMLDGGDWLVPRWLGEPFPDKPACYTWLQAASISMLGRCEAAVRLPGLLAGLLGAAATAMVGRRMLGRGAGLLAAVLYATTILPTALAQAATADVLLVPCVALAILAFWEAESARDARWILAGLALGASVLAKGLAGVALVGVAYAAYLTLSRRWSVAVCLRGLASLGVAAAMAAPWYAAMEWHAPGYLRYYFIERHVLGYATATQTHGLQPWWYYVPFLLGGGLPWIGYLPAALAEARTRRHALAPSDAPTAEPAAAPHPTRRAELLLGCWLLAGLLFLTLGRSKLVTYAWPLFPPVAILAAGAWRGLILGTLGEPARRMLAGAFWSSTVLAPAALPVAMLVAQSHFAVRFGAAAWTAAGAAALSAWIPGMFWIAGRPRAVLAAATLNVTAQFVVIVTLLLPPVAETLSARALAVHFNRSGRLPAQLWLSERRAGSLLFYLEPELREQANPEQLRRVRIAEMPEPAADTLLLVSEKWAGRMERREAALVGVRHEQVGRYRLYRAADWLAAVEPRYKERLARAGPPPELPLW